MESHKLWSRGLTRSSDKEKSLYLSQVAMTTKLCSMATYRDRLLPITSHDYMVLQGHVTNENHYISTTRVPMATKLTKVVI